MSLFTHVPVVDINKKNLAELWPSIVLAVKSSYFVAVDLELSGLGNRKALNAKSIEERYKVLSEVAKTHAIISLGISCFKHVPRNSADKAKPSGEQGNTEVMQIDETHDAKNWRFLVQTFNIMVLCSESYTVEPESLQFLVEHDFDFNRQYALGIPYYRGNDKSEEKLDRTLRQLFVELLKAERPLVVHNGLIDLIFLYHSFYCKLPKNFQSFVADLSDMFAGGIYDTKYIAEFRARMPASYLEYVFRKRQRENLDKMQNNKMYVDLEFLNYGNNNQHVSYRDCRINISEHSAVKQKQEICRSYANYGWCHKRQECNLSHNIDDIIDVHVFKKAKKSKKKNQQQEESNEEVEESSLLSNGQGGDSGEEKMAKIPYISGCHRAGYDAFMTGFSFATFLSSYAKKLPVSGDVLKAKEIGVEDLMNNVYLVGKSMPLLITASTFAKCTFNHTEKKAKMTTADCDMTEVML